MIGIGQMRSCLAKCGVGIVIMLPLAPASTLTNTDPLHRQSATNCSMMYASVWHVTVHQTTWISSASVPIVTVRRSTSSYFTSYTFSRTCISSIFSHWPLHCRCFPLVLDYLGYPPWHLTCQWPTFCMHCILSPVQVSWVCLVQVYGAVVTWFVQ